MPEGDTIFRSARALGRALTGKQVDRFETAYAPLASVHDNTPVTGRRIERVESRGKWLLIHMSGDLILVTHMLMSGSWHIYRAGERWRRGRAHMRIVLAAGDFEAVAFDVPVARFYTARTLARQSAIPAPGSDVLQPEFDSEDALARLSAEAGAQVADALLNQRVMAGIGNVFKSEICFACGVNPFRKVASLTQEQKLCLVDTARRQMAANVKEDSPAGIVTYQGARRTTGGGDPGSRLWVYGRQGRACRRCGAAILMRKQGVGARSTYWCPQCQPAPEGTVVAGWAEPIRRRKVGCG